ncbi:hypothetical protein FRC10_007153 [Ceratobasidium sp. 414]|nr:hypothetical protein FRC10_007153 [Ceratobasidium sp. 414]
MESPNATQVPATSADILDTAEGYECVDGKLIPWAPVTGARKLTAHSKMKCPICSMIVGVSYSGKRFLALHQGGKRCQQAQRKLNSNSTSKPRCSTSGPGSKPMPASESEPEKPASDNWTGIREYYESLGLLRKPPKPKSKAPIVGTSTGSSPGSGRASASPTVTDSSMVTLVEDMLLTPPLVPTGFTPLPPSLSLPLPVAFVSKSKPIPPAVPSIASASIGLGRNHGSKYDPSRQIHGQGRGPNMEHLHRSSHGLALKRKPSPIVIEDSSDDEPSPACVPGVEYEPAHGPVDYGYSPGSTKRGMHGFADIKGTEVSPGVRVHVPPNMDDSKHFVLQAGLVDGEMKFWDETPEGQRFLAALKESVGKFV